MLTVEQLKIRLMRVNTDSGAGYSFFVGAALHAGNILLNINNFLLFIILIIKYLNISFL